MKPDFDTLVCPSPGGCAGGAVADIPSQLASAMELRLMDRMPLMVFLLGPEREIAYGNELFLNSLRPEVRNGILGLRLGEALGCVHVLRYKKRCGTTPACRNCGAAKAILKSLRGIEHCEECHLTVRKEDGVHALDLQILARPCEIAQQVFSLCSALDISHERTLASQHRAFLHSMINAAGGMDMLLTLTGDGSDEDMEDRLSLLHNSARTMLAAVLYQYDVMAAESGRLEAFSTDCRILDVVEHAAELGRMLPAARDRRIDVQGEDGPLRTDVRLLRHVLGSLFANALEAVAVGGVVRVAWFWEGPDWVLNVDNSGEISSDVADALFVGPVSTKGRDRGIGLLMAGIFVRTYLGGRLELVPQDGPTVRFQLRLPK